MLTLDWWFIFIFKFCIWIDDFTAVINKYLSEIAGRCIYWRVIFNISATFKNTNVKAENWQSYKFLDLFFFAKTRLEMPLFSAIFSKFSWGRPPKNPTSRGWGVLAHPPACKWPCTTLNHFFYLSTISGALTLSRNVLDPNDIKIMWIMKNGCFTLFQ